MTKKSTPTQSAPQPMPLPQRGGSYTYDPETGGHTETKEGK